MPRRVCASSSVAVAESRVEVAAVSDDTVSWRVRTQSWPVAVRTGTEVTVDTAKGGGGVGARRFRASIL